MRKIISFMHLSLDGFVSGPNGEMDWITVDEEIFNHVGKRISEGDTALYGRVTYQMMENYWPNAGNKPAATKHEIVANRITSFISRLKMTQSQESVLPLQPSQALFTPM